jgi:hypothetical protein
VPPGWAGPAVTERSEIVSLFAGRSLALAQAACMSTTTSCVCSTPSTTTRPNGIRRSSAWITSERPLAGTCQRKTRFASRRSSRTSAGPSGPQLPRVLGPGTSGTSPDSWPAPPPGAAVELYGCGIAGEVHQRIDVEPHKPCRRRTGPGSDPRHGASRHVCGDRGAVGPVRGLTPDMAMPAVPRTPMSRV